MRLVEWREQAVKAAYAQYDGNFTHMAQALDVCAKSVSKWCAMLGLKSNFEKGVRAPGDEDYRLPTNAERLEYINNPHKRYYGPFRTSKQYEKALSGY